MPEVSYAYKQDRLHTWIKSRSQSIDLQHKPTLATTISKNLSLILRQLQQISTSPETGVAHTHPITQKSNLRTPL